PECRPEPRAPAPGWVLTGEPVRFEEPETIPDHAAAANRLTETDDEPATGLLARFGFEELFWRQVRIWLGGIALAVAGMLIVRYSIERGLLSPEIRVVAGLAFG